jgi:hypothetical protein
MHRILNLIYIFSTNAAWNYMYRRKCNRIHGMRVATQLIAAMKMSEKTKDDCIHPSRRWRVISKQCRVQYHFLKNLTMTTMLFQVSSFSHSFDLSISATANTYNHGQSSTLQDCPCFPVVLCSLAVRPLRDWFLSTKKTANASKTSKVSASRMSIQDDVATCIYMAVLDTQNVPHFFTITLF